DAAARLLDTVWTTDRSYVGTAFRLARIRLGQGDRGGAARVLDTVPELSSLYTAAQTAAVVAQVTADDPGTLAEADLTEAGRRLERLGLQGEVGDRLRARVLETALEWTLAGHAPARPVRLLGDDLDEEGLRRNLERTYRALARTATDPAERRRLVDWANASRAETWICPRPAPPTPPPSAPGRAPRGYRAVPLPPQRRERRKATERHRASPARGKAGA